MGLVVGEVYELGPPHYQGEWLRYRTGTRYLVTKKSDDHITVRDIAFSNSPEFLIAIGSTIGKALVPTHEEVEWE